jgi:small-conductance mechanosensitive channel
MIWDILSDYQHFVLILAYIAGGLILHWVVKRVLFMAGKKYQPKALHWVFLNNISKIMIAVVVIYASLSSIPHLHSISTVLLTSSSILVAAIGLASQKTFSNALNGLIISLAKPFAVGDRIRLIRQNVTGFVENVNLSHTIIRTIENNRLLIPNATVLEDVIENLNYTDNRICNFVDVNVTFGADLDLAQAIIIDAATKHPLWVDIRTEEEIKNNVPVLRVLVRDISDRRVELRAGLWSKSLTESFVLCSEIRKEIVERFNQNNVELYNPLYIQTK